jgi:hypothetical protein
MSANVQSRLLQLLPAATLALVVAGPWLLGPAGRADAADTIAPGGPMLTQVELSAS